MGTGVSYLIWTYRLFFKKLLHYPTPNNQQQEEETKKQRWKVKMLMFNNNNNNICFPLNSTNKIHEKKLLYIYFFTNNIISSCQKTLSLLPYPWQLIILSLFTQQYNFYTIIQYIFIFIPLSIFYLPLFMSTTLTNFLSLILPFLLLLCKKGFAGNRTRASRTQSGNFTT